jgi:hypothetical protein
MAFNYPVVSTTIASLYSSTYGWNGATLTAGWTNDLGASDVAFTSEEGFAAVRVGTVAVAIGVRVAAANTFLANQTLVVGLRSRQEATGGGCIVALTDGSGKYVTSTARNDRLYFQRWTNRSTYSADEDGNELGNDGNSPIYWCKVVDNGVTRQFYWLNAMSVTPPTVSNSFWQGFAGGGVSRTAFLTADRWGFGGIMQNAGGTRSTGVELIHAVVTAT